MKKKVLQPNKPNQRSKYQALLSVLSHLFETITPHPLVAPWVAIVAAIGFCGFAILLVEIRKS